MDRFPHQVWHLSVTGFSWYTNVCPFHKLIKPRFPCGPEQVAAFLDASVLCKAETPAFRFCLSRLTSQHKTSSAWNNKALTLPGHSALTIINLNSVQAHKKKSLDAKWWEGDDQCSSALLPSAGLWQVHIWVFPREGTSHGCGLNFYLWFLWGFQSAVFPTLRWLLWVRFFN